MGSHDSYRAWWKAQLTGRKLLFYVIWHTFHISLFWVGWFVQKGDERLAGLNTLKYSVWISRGAGLCLSVDGALILLPMCRNLLRLIRPKIRWLPLDESQFFHRQVAYSLILYASLHTGAHYVNFFNVEKKQLRPEKALHIHYAEAGGITGHIMLLCLLLMSTSAHSKIRQQSYETFYYVHHLYIVFLLSLYTHATGCFVRSSKHPYSPFAGKDFWEFCIGYEGWRWELWGGGIFLIERIYREIRARRKTEISSVIKHPHGVVELQFRKPSMQYRPGQWLFLKVPSVSKYQWHPFTISSTPQDPYISVHMRSLGDWTRDVANAFGAGEMQQKLYDGLDPQGMYEIALQHGQQMPKIMVDGPYGAPAEDVFDNEIAVLIGAGVGVTPFSSILKNIWYIRNGPNPPKRLKRVEFIWSCSAADNFSWFNALLQDLESQQPDRNSDFLKIHTYLTQKMTIEDANNLVLNSVGADYDPVTNLESRMRFGRPDYLKFLLDMRNGIVSQTYLSGIESDARVRVGVYFCGPSGAARTIRTACKAATNQDVNFSFHKEHF